MQFLTVSVVELDGATIPTVTIEEKKVPGKLLFTLNGCDAVIRPLAKLTLAGIDRAKWLMSGIIVYRHTSGRLVAMPGRIAYETWHIMRKHEVWEDEIGIRVYVTSFCDGNGKFESPRDVITEYIRDHAPVRDEVNRTRLRMIDLAVVPDTSLLTFLIVFLSCLDFVSAQNDNLFHYLVITSIASTVFWIILIFIIRDIYIRTLDKLSTIGAALVKDYLEIRRAEAWGQMIVGIGTTILSVTAAFLRRTTYVQQGFFNSSMSGAKLKEFGLEIIGFATAAVLILFPFVKDRKWLMTSYANIKSLASSFETLNKVFDRIRQFFVRPSSLYAPFSKPACNNLTCKHIKHKGVIVACKNKKQEVFQCLCHCQCHYSEYAVLIERASISDILAHYKSRNACQQALCTPIPVGPDFQATMVRELEIWKRPFDLGRNISFTELAAAIISWKFCFGGVHDTRNTSKEKLKSEAVDNGIYQGRDMEQHFKSSGTKDEVLPPASQPFTPKPVNVDTQIKFVKGESEGPVKPENPKEKVEKQPSMEEEIDDAQFVEAREEPENEVPSVANKEAYIGDLHVNDEYTFVDNNQTVTVYKNQGNATSFFSQCAKYAPHVGLLLLSLIALRLSSLRTVAAVVESINEGKTYNFKRGATYNKKGKKQSQNSGEDAIYDAMERAERAEYRYVEEEDGFRRKTKKNRGKNYDVEESYVHQVEFENTKSRLPPVSDEILALFGKEVAQYQLQGYTKAPTIPVSEIGRNVFSINGEDGSYYGNATHIGNKLVFPAHILPRGVTKCIAQSVDDRYIVSDPRAFREVPDFGYFVFNAPKSSFKPGEIVQTSPAAIGYWDKDKNLQLSFGFASPQGLHTMATQDGTCGAPVLSGDKGNPVVIGIHHGYFPTQQIGRFIQFTKALVEEIKSNSSVMKPLENFI